MKESSRERTVGRHPRARIDQLQLQPRTTGAGRRILPHCIASAHRFVNVERARTRVDPDLCGITSCSCSLQLISICMSSEIEFDSSCLQSICMRANSNIDGSRSEIRGMVQSVLFRVLFLRRKARQRRHVRRVQLRSPAVSLFRVLRAFRPVAAACCIAP